MIRSISLALARACTSVTALALSLGAAAALHAQSAKEQTDELFARWNVPNSPGCAVGVDRAGQSVLRRAYGMAELEWGMENTPETIFENGSVSKQFTAGAIVLLAMEGKLSLDDDVRRYVPELPDYPETITLRHMLNHTSGLRDWGSVAGLSGWGRSVRTHDHDDVLDILGRQSALNFTPGHEYSYSNSGYNLLAIIVSRVSGMSFAEFSNERIFEPLGMTNTQWRDNYTRIVPGRSSAYTARNDGSFTINRPIENVHGNGGLLTTVSDLLTWNRSLDEASLAGPEFVEMMETQGVLNNGRTIDYALGLTVNEAFGQRLVSHGGATSGYRAGLVRFPDQQLSVAVLCNVTNANGYGLALDVGEIHLGDLAQDGESSGPRTSPGASVSAESLGARAGLYASTMRPNRAMLALGDDGQLRFGGNNGSVLVPQSEAVFDVSSEEGTRIEFLGPEIEGRQGFEVRYGDHLLNAYVPAGDWDPTPDDLEDLVGLYESEDAQFTLQVKVEAGGLMLVHPVLGPARLRPLYQDTFGLGPRTLRFRRLTGGRVHELSIAEARIYDMRFRKTH